jgi:selenide,water dikinase
VIPRPAAELVLVGAGHAHVQVLRRWLRRPLPGVRLSVVLDRPEALYSGMVPGCVAGDYRPHQLEIDGVPLARRAGARVLLARAVGVDPLARRIALEGRPPVAYDVASLDVGSRVRGLELPGVREHALATRPIRRFVDELAERLDAARERAAGGVLEVAVVGGGAAGFEPACGLEARLRRERVPACVHLVSDAPQLLPGASGRLARIARREAQRRGIRVLEGARVVEVEPHRIRFADDREPLACQLTVWATGAAAPALAAAPLPLDERGFVRVRSTLQVMGCDDLFAAGDCASLDAHPGLPKAGVYAVRQGPVLDANLRARLAGRRLRRYRPQRDFLTLLNLGDRRALGGKWGLAWSGAAVWRLKDRIDRRFVRRFQLLAPDGSPAPDFPAPPPARPPMACGGCAAKLDAPSLERALARLAPAPPDASVQWGLERADDAALVGLPGGERLLASLDGFRAFADDPWLVGRVAAVNAVSDVLAKGGRPRHALALVTLPEEQAAAGVGGETLAQVLAGVRASLDPLGVSLVGGHTATGPELFVALSVTGDLEAGARPLPLAGAQPGQRLLLSKALGTGVVLAADALGLARGAWLQDALRSMLRPNLAAAQVARRHGASAGTDVSGFGLAGHLAALLRAGGVAARLRRDALPALPGARALLARGLRSSAHARNAQLRDVLDPGVCGGPDASLELLFDPQTSGGLLFALPADRADAALAELRAGGDAAAACIGEVSPPRPGGALLGVD